MVKTQRSTS